MGMSIRVHVMPGEPGDSAWFGRLNAFERAETERQVLFKRKHWPNLSDGAWVKKKGGVYTYPHILPKGETVKALYPAIAPDVLQYMVVEGIALHSAFLNLKSSQACCFNVLFPLRNDLALAAVALKPCLPQVTEVTNIEFEYTGPSGATAWLGESSGGRRGQNRTSIDAAVWWKSGSNSYLTLIEWKYTEKTYGTCGGYHSKGNKNRSICDTLRVSPGAQPSDCYLAKGKHTRRYWQHLTMAGFDLSRVPATVACPFRGPFYQLMRQYLLAAYCRQHGAVQDVFVVAVGFKNNTFLHKQPPHLSALGCDVESAWNARLSTAPPLRSVFAEDIVAAARAAPHLCDQNWLNYLQERYRL